jgi:hypothetical protein
LSSSRRAKRKFPTKGSETGRETSAPLSQPSPPPPVPRFPEAAGAILVLVIALLLLAAYSSDRGGAVDEVGLFNPSYVDLHYGKISYPVYDHWDSMVVHPPVHYKIIAAFMRLGLTYYYAEATPALLLLLAGVLLIAYSGFPVPVKIGLLCGLVGPIAIFATQDLELFGMRPENHINAAWLAGLIALESGRYKNWEPKRLFVGAFLLTYASGLHYYAAPALLGIPVYMIWSVVQLGWRRAVRPLLVLTAGGLLFGIPYLRLFLIPDWTQVVAMLRSVPQEGIREILRHHIVQYHVWASGHIGLFGLELAFRWGIPAVLLSTPILIAIPATRALGLAALPLELFVLLFAGHKHAYYFVHEVSLYCIAAVAGGAMLIDRLASMVPRRPLLTRRIALTAASLIVGGTLLAAKWNAGYSAILPEVRLQDAEIARAAGKEMLGPNARVGSRIGAWYSSGGEHWYQPSPDLLWRKFPPNFDVAQFVSRFDAVAEYAHMSSVTNNDRNGTLSSWYADGTLRLGGFFFTDSNQELSYLLLRGTPASPIRGYALRHRNLVRFEENAAGDYELLSLACPVTLEGDFRARVPYSNVLYLPRQHLEDVDRSVVTALIPTDGPRSYAELHPECGIVLRIRGFLSPVDRKALVEKMRREDKPMLFYRQLSEMLESNSH